jgi:hypothetical protein
MKKRLAQFEELTGIKAVYTYVPYGQVRDKITTEAVAGSSEIDVVCYQDNWGPSLSIYLHPLDELLKRDGLDINRFTRKSLQARRPDRGGVTYGLPGARPSQMLFYRKGPFRCRGPQAADDLGRGCCCGCRHTVGQSDVSGRGDVLRQGQWPARTSSSGSIICGARAATSFHPTSRNPLHRSGCHRSHADVSGPFAEA